MDSSKEDDFEDDEGGGHYQTTTSTATTTAKKEKYNKICQPQSALHWNILSRIQTMSENPKFVPKNLKIEI